MTKEQSKEVAVREPGAVSGVPSMEQWRLMREMATELLKSGFLPDTIKTAEQAVAIILAGRELGLPPMLSLRLINVIKGKPAMCSEGMAGLVFDRIPGARLNLIESTEDVATYEAQRPGGEPVTLSFTWKEAQRIRVKTKGEWKDLIEGLSWQNYRAAMLRARCCSAICRIVFPDVTLKIYTPEELGAEVNAKGEFLRLPEDAGTTIGLPEPDTSIEDEEARETQTRHYGDEEPEPVEAEVLPPEPAEDDTPPISKQGAAADKKLKALYESDKFKARSAAFVKERIVLIKGEELPLEDLAFADLNLLEVMTSYKLDVIEACIKDTINEFCPAKTGIPEFTSGERKALATLLMKQQDKRGDEYREGDTCPMCGKAELIIKPAGENKDKGTKWNAFLTCPRFPKCKFSADLPEE